MKKLFIILGVVLLLVGGILVFKNQIIKYAVTRATATIIGAPVHMDRFSLSIVKSTIHISGFTISNPSGFPEGTLLYCPKINIIYDRSTLFKKKRHLLLVEFDLKEMEITKNKEGKLNVDSLKIAQQSESSPSTPMQIDLVTLRIGKIIFKDYTKGTEPSVLVHDVNKQKSYKGIPSAQQLALLVIAEPMKDAMIKNAGIYGVALLTGVAVVPVAVVATFIGKDSVQQIIDVPFERAYEVSLEVMKRMGRITKEDVSDGVIKAKIKGTSVSLQIKKNDDGKTEMTISARKFLLFPKLDVAGGVLYQILDELE